MKTNKISITQLFYKDIERLFIANKIEKYRAKQVYDWVFKKNVSDFSQMANIPKLLRESLDTIFTLDKPRIAQKNICPDGTCKYLLELNDGNFIECVYLPYEDRHSICVSSQVGCAIGCSFCASCDTGFERNLTPPEIINQILTVQNDIKQKISHVVFMGIGEPLLNVENVYRSIRIINENLEISERRITVSTCGIIRGIKRLADFELDVTLALSLHSPRQKERQEIIPIAKLNWLDELLAACDYYVEKTKRRITFEYLLIDGINNSDAHARELAHLAKRHKAHINLIPYNSVEGKPYKRPEPASITRFHNILNQYKIEVTQRFEKGADFESACGQLRNQKSGYNKNQ